MASLKEVRNRIDSVKSTQQITNAMKMVAASKLRKAQDAIYRLRPYSNKFNEIIKNITLTTGVTDHNPYAPRPGEMNRVLIVAVSSNKGLCGMFNMSVIKSVLDLLNGELKDQTENGQVDLICVGKKVHEYFLKRGTPPIVGEYNDIYQELTFERAEAVASTLLQGYSSGIWDKVVIVYNRFQNATLQVVTQEQYLPLLDLPEGSQDEPFWGIDYIYEPEKTEILEEMIPRALKLQFFKTLLDSYASEHGARMTAMHQATENAGEMLKELRLAYNKARQAAITREIIEIVSGAEALNG